MATPNTAFRNGCFCWNWCGVCHYRFYSVVEDLLKRLCMKLEGTVVSGNGEKVRTAVRDQMQEFLIGGGDSKCELSKGQEFARLSEKLANHLSGHLGSEPVPI